jgi:hypothetical protein
MGSVTVSIEGIGSRLMRVIVGVTHDRLNRPSTGAKPGDDWLTDYDAVRTTANE